MSTIVTGDEFRFIRVGYGLTTADAAEMCGVSRRLIVSIETGTSPMRQRYAARLESAIGSKWFNALRAQYKIEYERQQAEAAAAKERRTQSTTHTEETADGDD